MYGFKYNILTRLQTFQNRHKSEISENPYLLKSCGFNNSSNSYFLGYKIINLKKNLELKMVDWYVKRMNLMILGACLAGVLLSVYSLNVEKHLHKNKDYKAACDLSKKVSCTKVFKSKYSKGMGLIDNKHPLSLPNGAYGILFYSLVGFLTLSDNLCTARVQLFLTLMGVAASAYLAYILITVLHDFCIVCVATYILNGICLVATYSKYNELVCEYDSEFSCDEC